MNGAASPRRRRRVLVAALVVASAAIGTASFFLVPRAPTPSLQQGPVQSAKLGVFFGGQVQERTELPLMLEKLTQTQGFRLEFKAPLERDVAIDWEVDMPRRGTRLAKLGHVVARVGQRSLDQEVAFAPGDEPGVWNFRLFVDGALVLDRALRVVPSAGRTRDSAGNEADDLP
jgi:hypothetical protein